MHANRKSSEEKTSSGVFGAHPGLWGLIMIHSSIESEELHALSDALLRMQTRDEIERFLGDLCSPSELQAMAQRFAVARMLRNGKRGAEIIKATGSSTATIARVNRSLRYGQKGYALAFDREDKEKEKHDGHER